MSEKYYPVGLVFVDDPLNQTNPSVEGISPGIDPVHDQFITRHSLVKYCDHVGDNTFRSGERVNIHASAALHYSSVGSYASVHLPPRSCLSSDGTCELNRDRVGVVLGQTISTFGSFHWLATVWPKVAFEILRQVTAPKSRLQGALRCHQPLHRSCGNDDEPC